MADTRAMLDVVATVRHSDRRKPKGFFAQVDARAKDVRHPHHALLTR